MDSSHAFPAPETISANLRMILRGVLAALGMWRLEVGQMLVLHRRVGLIAARIERMLQRHRAGRLWRVMARAAQRQPITRRSPPTMPRRFGWLVQAGGHQAAGFASQLQTALAAPEMAALLAVAPQAGRILRPLCRALAVELPAPRSLPTPTRAVRAPRRCAPAALLTAPEPSRIRLPRGVLAAARREGFGKDR